MAAATVGSPWDSYDSHHSFFGIPDDVPGPYHFLFGMRGPIIPYLYEESLGPDLQGGWFPCLSCEGSLVIFLLFSFYSSYLLAQVPEPAALSPHGSLGLLLVPL